MLFPSRLPPPATHCACSDSARPLLVLSAPVWVFGLSLRLSPVLAELAADSLLLLAPCVWLLRAPLGLLAPAEALAEAPAGCAAMGTSPMLLL